VLILGCPKEGVLPLAFARAGLSVTSIDTNRMAIEAAQKKAQQEKLTIQYTVLTVKEIQFKNEFDFVLMADCGFGVFSDEDRDQLLNKIHAALKPNTFFAFNVFTKYQEDLTKTYKDWIIQPNGGFFYSTSHLELINHVHYESHGICLDQHVVFDHIGETHIYNLWDRYYSVPSLVNILKNFKFKGAKLTKDFTGVEHQETDDTIAMIVRKI
jgi:SAM-dependent methyltransferase